MVALPACDFVSGKDDTCHGCEYFYIIKEEMGCLSESWGFHFPACLICFWHRLR